MRPATPVVVWLAVLMLFGCSEHILDKFPEPPAPVCKSPVNPGGSYRWTPGKWSWSKKGDYYVWRDGRWTGSRKHTKWVDGHWVETVAGTRYVAGHWK